MTVLPSRIAIQRVWLFAAVLLLASHGHAQPMPMAGQVASQPARAIEALSRPQRIGSVPSDAPVAGTLALTRQDAIERALRANLGAVLAEQGVRTASGARLSALAGVLPSVEGAVSNVRQTTNLEAFGLSLPGFPKLIGPFTIHDARISVAQPIFDLSAIARAQAGGHGLRAARFSRDDAREMVVLAATTLYSQTLAARARIRTTEAQLATAEALATQATDMQAAGVVPGIDVLRARVQADSVRQRLIVARNEYERAKLDLARAIGLPLGQRFEPGETFVFTPVDVQDPDRTMQQALTTRADLRSAQERVAAAQFDLASAQRERFPAIDFQAAYGDIGQTWSGAIVTYSIAALLRVPVFDEARIRGRTTQASAALERERALLADLRGQIDYEVRTALFDVAAAQERVAVAQEEVDLAAKQLEQARDRFSAGVANNLEVVEAQQSVALANETLIGSYFAHDVAKASLARAVGTLPAGTGQDGGRK